MDEAIAEDVLRFIADRIETVPHLEALLLLWQSGDRHWTAEEIATRVYVDAGTAASLLQDLTRRGLIAVHGAPAPRYVYDLGWDPGGQLMPKVAATYRRHLIRVAELIHSKASPGVREFARAFQLKKE